MPGNYYGDASTTAGSTRPSTSAMMALGAILAIGFLIWKKRRK